MCAPCGHLVTTVKLPCGSCGKSMPRDTAYVRSYGSGIAHPYRERLGRRECNGGALHTDRAGTRRLCERGRRSRKHSQISDLAFTFVLTTTAARGEKYHNYQSENVLRQ